MPGDRRDHQDRQSGDGHQPDAEDDQVDLHALVRLGQPCRPDRHQRRRGHRDPYRGAAAGRGHHARTGHRQPEQLPPVGPQGAQDGIIRSAGDQLAAEQLADDNQDGQADQSCEQGQRVRLRLDRLLDLRLLISQVEHLDTLGGGVVACQPARLASELTHIGSGPQAHQRLHADVGKRPALAAAVERGCQLNLGEMVERGDRDDLVVEHDHASHPEPELDRPAQIRLVVCARRGHEQAQSAARAQAVAGGQLRVDDHLVRAAGAVHPARQHLEPIDQGAEAPVHADVRADRGDPGTAGKDQPHVPDLTGQHPRLPGHPGKAGQRREIALSAGIRDYGHIGCPASLQQPRERRASPLRPRGRGQHHPAGQAHHQRQRQPRPPAGPQLGTQHQPGNPQHPAASRRPHQLTSAATAWPAHQGHGPIPPRRIPGQQQCWHAHSRRTSPTSRAVACQRARLTNQSPQVAANR